MTTNNNKIDLSIIIPVYNENESAELMLNIFFLYLKLKIEVIIVYDFDEDSTVEIARKLQKKYTNIKIIKNNSTGAKNALLTGLKESSSDIILLTVIDELCPITSYEKMHKLIKEDSYDLVSATRYKRGGKRYGGSILGHFFSKTANFVLHYMFKFPLSDATTGIKMFKKSIFDGIELKSNIGWSFALELSLKSYLIDLKITEYPIKSIDRIFGGSSTFHFFLWIKKYYSIIIWGVYQIIKKKFK